MLSDTMTIAAATRRGTALPGVRTPWAFLAPAGVEHARTQLFPGVAAVSLYTRPFASQRGPAMAQQLAVMAADLLPTVNEARKHNVHKTRIGAGGYGAMGPHPEREPA